MSRDEETHLFTTLRGSREVVRRHLLDLTGHMSATQRRSVEADTLRYEEVSEVWEELPNSIRMGLSPSARRTVGHELRSWKSSRDRLLKSNQRLVIYTVKRFRNEPSLFMDPIQEGNIGLMRAVDGYDPD